MASRIRLALYQPDIPQNTGAILRLAACLDVPVDIIFPCGFAWDDRRLRRAGMDYLDGVALTRHDSWQAFLDAPGRTGRLVLLTTRAAVGHVEFMFRPGDTLILGRESEGAPERVRQAAAASVRVAMRAGMRSLNVAVAAGIVLGEALRQTGQYPGQIA
ncbi:MAG: tRNA (cytidine(34)-2'-O)-methyltransferase [Rhodospirillales bacterium]